MSDLEPFDDELAAAFRRRADGGPTATADAHDAVVRRAGAIRRRRATIGGSVAMAALLVGGFALLPRDPDEIGPAVTGDVLPSFEEPSTTTATTIPADDTTEDAAPAIVDLPIPPVSAPTSAPTSVQDTSVPVTTVGPTSPPPTSSVPGAIAPSSSSTSTAPSTSDPSTSTTATSEPEPTLAPFTNTYRSAGGSITVSWSGSALTLEAASPEPGFVADVEDASATRIRVRFESESDDGRIEVRISDGRVLVDID